MKALFWCLCGLIAWSYVLYPALMVLLAAMAGRRYRMDESYEPFVSILVPAYNEEPVIAAKLENARALDYPPGRLEIIVASESTDGTDDVVRSFAGRAGAPVRLITSAERLGKVANLRRAVPVSRGDILVFTDANAMFDRDALHKLVRWFADPRVGAVSGRLVLSVPGSSASGKAEEAYWDLEMILKKASSALGSLPGANGSLFALRRDVYHPISERRGDDFELPIRAVISGHASLLEPEAVSREGASPRYRDEYRRKVRIVNWMIVSALILLGEALRAGRWLLAFQLLSHKLNRWASALWLLALAPISLLLASQGGVYLLACVAQALVYALAFCGFLIDRAGRGEGGEGGGGRMPRIFGVPLYFVIVNSAALMGMLTCVLGREVMWHKRPDGAA